MFSEPEGPPTSFIVNWPVLLKVCIFEFPEVVSAPPDAATNLFEPDVSPNPFAEAAPRVDNKGIKKSP
jgi:hypothetical protein